MVLVENLVTAVFTVIALALALVSLRAWFHTRSRKVLLLTIGFSLFFLKGVFFSYQLFATPDWQAVSFVPGLILDVAALIVFYAAVVQRRR
jgi:hypothetical protein